MAVIVFDLVDGLIGSGWAVKHVKESALVQSSQFLRQAHIEQTDLVALAVAVRVWFLCTDLPAMVVLVQEDEELAVASFVHCGPAEGLVVVPLLPVLPWEKDCI